MNSIEPVFERIWPEMVFSVNLNELLRDVLEVCTPRLLRAGVVVDWHPAATLPPLLGRPLQLRMLFKALVDNAIEAMDTKGWKRRELTLATSVVRNWATASSSMSSGATQPWVGSGVDAATALTVAAALPLVSAFLTTTGSSCARKRATLSGSEYH